MPPMTKPQKNLPPPPKPATPSAPTRVSFVKIGLGIAGHRIVLYGTGGIGKTTLACSAPGPVAFVDADESLERLKGQLDEQGIGSPLRVQVSNWKELRAALQGEGWDGIKTLVLDSITKVEEWALAYTLATVKHEKDYLVKNLEGYGYGKGYQHVFETFLPLLGDLDKLARKGVNIILIAHDCVSKVPNPQGDDWIRYEPRLQDPSSGKASIRLRVKEWADHMLFLGYDVAVKDSVGTGSGTRTIYTSELPHCMAKSRTTQEQIPIVLGESPWDSVIR